MPAEVSSRTAAYDTLKAIDKKLEFISDAEYFSEYDSGYGSGGTGGEAVEVIFTRPHLRYLNRQLQGLSPQEILRWCIMSLPKLYQTTAFGLTGLATMDMLSKIDVPGHHPVEMIFLDTLYHFDETHELISQLRQRYPDIKLHIFKPEGCGSREAFEAKHGERLWERYDQVYDYETKVEPAQRAYRELNVSAVLTGRRRSQGGKRGDLDIIEVDDAGLIKINPLANWSFQQVQTYIRDNNVPYNALLDRGYKSIGDWHSTQPVGEGDGERSGRWKGQQKTECGIHNPRSKYAQFLRDQEMKRKLEKELMDDFLFSAELDGW